MSPPPAGFASPRQNLLIPLLALAPAGHAALAGFERIHELNRKLMIHPVFAPDLQAMIDRLPAPELIPIQMPALAASADIPWQSAAPDLRFLVVRGRPDGADYIYDLAKDADPPREPGRMATVISVGPPAGTRASTQSVKTKFKASLYLSDTITPRCGLDAALGFAREIEGSMAPPWDGVAGVFNQHDQAAMDRLRRDLPATSALLNRYFRFFNVLDEFFSRSGPLVLVNLQTELRQERMDAYPYLRRFWREAAGHLALQSAIRDQHGRRWMIARLDRGRITLVFLLRDGMLTPMDAAMGPAGNPLAIGQLRGGRFYLDSEVLVRRFGMRMGLSAIRFAFDYDSDDGSYRLDSHLTTLPTLIAPPIIHRLTLAVAGEYLKTLARGDGGQGIATTFAAEPGPQGGTMLSGSISAELRDAPALALLARIASAWAPDYGRQVRKEQRRLIAEFFDAFDSDYRRARPLLLKSSGDALSSHQIAWKR